MLKFTYYNTENIDNLKDFLQWQDYNELFA